MTSIRFRTLVLFTLAVPSAVAASPQAPLATGTPASIRVAIRAAHRCGISKVHTQPTVGRKGNVSLYSDIDPPDYLRAYDCVRSWVLANSKKLRITLD